MSKPKLGSKDKPRTIKCFTSDIVKDKDGKDWFCRNIAVVYRGTKRLLVPDSEYYEYVHKFLIKIGNEYYKPVKGYIFTHLGMGGNRRLCLAPEYDYFDKNKLREAHSC